MSSRRNAAILALALVAGGAFAACQRPFDEAGALVAGQAVVAPFRKELAATLLAAVAKSPANAVDVCSVEAPAIAARAAKPGVQIGRSSPRLRNDGKPAPAWVAPLLRELEAGRAPDGTSRAVALSGGRAGYVSAIAVGPVCLTCHGKTIDAAVKARLDERYPRDRATGYELGDFRGVFWAEFPVH